jgi:hypothetical protein
MRLNEVVKEKEHGTADSGKASEKIHNRRLVFAGEKVVGTGDVSLYCALYCYVDVLLAMTGKILLCRNAGGTGCPYHPVDLIRIAVP